MGTCVGTVQHRAFTWGVVRLRSQTQSGSVPLYIDAPEGAGGQGHNQ
jgi:hypothetical protein